MLRKLLIPGALLGLCLGTCLRGAGRGSSPEPAVKAGTHATIRCADGFQVPITEDAERALPLRLIGGVSCGEQVTVLADTTGLTIEIRTADGKEGYVERTYVSAVSASAPKAQPVHANADSGIARWQLGAPGCDKFFSSGLLVESLTAEGITVQASLQDTGRKVRASVAIANQSATPAYFDPASFTLDELMPRLRSLAYQNPRALFKRRTEQASVTNLNVVAPGTTAADRPEYRNAALVQSTPDYLISEAAQPHSSALTATTVAPNEKVAGAVWFERDKNLQELTLRVFVGDQIFEFPLSFPQQ